MRDSLRRLFLLGTCLATLGPLPLLAQTTGDINGKVGDSANAPLPGVTLEARSPALQASRRTTSDGAGNFHFPLLPPGTYVVSARLAGFEDAEQPGVRVGLGETARVPMTLKLLAAAEVVVSGEAPLIDTTSTKIGTSLTDRRHLPAASRAELRVRHDDRRGDEPGRARLYDLRCDGPREPVPHRRAQHDRHPRSEIRASP